MTLVQTLGNHKVLSGERQGMAAQIGQKRLANLTIEEKVGERLPRGFLRRIAQP